VIRGERDGKRSPSLLFSSKEMGVMLLRVQDQFTSWQGTGSLSGVEQRFVRLAGCKVACPLRKNCDQEEALDDSAGDMISVPEIIGGIDCDWLHITGGEPAEHEHLVGLVDAAISAGHQVQVQTSGARAINWNREPFVTVSPKQRLIKTEPSEVVIVAAKWASQGFVLEATESLRCPIYIVPEATGRDYDPQQAKSLFHLLSGRGLDVRLGLQSHLEWGVA
jgi:organic radical activating enzyme